MDSLLKQVLNTRRLQDLAGVMRGLNRVRKGSMESGYYFRDYIRDPSTQTYTNEQENPLYEYSIDQVFTK